MSNKLVTTQAEAFELALVQNDLSKLTVDQRLTYYRKVCESVGLNPLTQPLAYISLQGKLTLYARKEATDQLRKIHGVSIQIVSKGIDGDLYTVHVKATDKTGRTDEDIASINIAGMKGNDLVNASMKCLTKAKRRITLSICGMGVLDESEIDTIPQEIVEVTENPQIPNPFQEEQKQIEAQSNDSGEYVVKGGRFSGKKLKELNREDLIGYIEWCEKSANGKPHSPAMKEFLTHAYEYLKESETPLDVSQA